MGDNKIACNQIILRSTVHLSYSKPTGIQGYISASSINSSHETWFDKLGPWLKQSVEHAAFHSVWNVEGYRKGPLSRINLAVTDDLSRRKLSAPFTECANWSSTLSHFIIF